MNTLPLFDSGLLAQPTGSFCLVQIETSPSGLIPLRAPLPGEQYRFHFDMTKCIGCKCCVVACNEQNGNPAVINWRRVGEIEGGVFPHTQRHHLSMGCNHCLEPSCMIGCPVEAYTKLESNGVVVHNPDQCIGCQYCTWNCSYGVPQYNPARGVVGKCDMCHNRLADGQAPACVSACPEGAITIELVDQARWREDHLHANAPGLPSSGDSLSTTRITLPENLAADADRVDTGYLVPEHPHLPLVFMLVVTQLCLGAFLALWALDLAGMREGLFATALAALTLAGMSLGASTFHLGRPAYAWRALKGLRRSWLSREVLTLSLFAGSASAYAAALFFALPVATLAGAATAFAGILGVTCSARIYIVKARPAWNSLTTVAEFFSTAALLGPLFVAMTGASHSPWLPFATAAGALAQLATQLVKFAWLSRSETYELHASAQLLSGRLRRQWFARLALLVAAGLLPLLSASPLALAGAFLLALAGEFLGRWLFFVSVVPKSMAASFALKSTAIRSHA